MFLVLVGKLVLGSRDDAQIVHVTGEGVMEEHCRITVLGDRVVITPINAVRVYYFTLTLIDIHLMWHLPRLLYLLTAGASPRYVFGLRTSAIRDSARCSVANADCQKLHFVDWRHGHLSTQVPCVIGACSMHIQNPCLRLQTPERCCGSGATCGAFHRA